MYKIRAEHIWAALKPYTDLTTKLFNLVNTPTYFNSGPVAFSFVSENQEYVTQSQTLQQSFLIQSVPCFFYNIIITFNNYNNI